MIAGDGADAVSQSAYQVRFDWGAAGARAIAGDTDVLVLVDALPADGVDAVPRAVIGAAGPAAHVLAASLRDRTAVARWIGRLQVERGARLRIAVVAIGTAGGDGVATRPAVEDLLAAGAVIDALVDVGIDAQSPEAAVAAAAYRTLRGGVAHLVRASVGGRTFVDPTVLSASVIVDAADEVRVLRRRTTD